MATSKINRKLFYRGNSMTWVNGTDLNNMTNTGFYPMSKNLSNAPSTWGILFVIGIRADTVEQVYFNAAGVYRREFRNGTWSAWNLLGG